MPRPKERTGNAIFAGGEAGYGIRPGIDMSLTPPMAQYVLTGSPGQIGMPVGIVHWAHDTLDRARLGVTINEAEYNRRIIERHPEKAEPEKIKPPTGSSLLVDEGILESYRRAGYKTDGEIIDHLRRMRMLEETADSLGYEVVRASDKDFKNMGLPEKSLAFIDYEKGKIYLKKELDYKDPDLPPAALSHELAHAEDVQRGSYTGVESNDERIAHAVAPKALEGIGLYRAAEVAKLLERLDPRFREKASLN